MARPPIELNLKQIQAAAAIGCTQEDIARLVGVSERTISRRADAREAIAQGMAVMRTSLRRMQWEKAKDGNVTMMIWLGKQMLGQKDRVEETHREEVVEIQRIAPRGE
jgi:predicted transcriptional regulator